MSSPLPQYRYEPLESSDHVRVLVLEPALDFDSQLEASVIQYDRTSMYIQVKPVYEAISYTWGDPTTTQLITLDQITHLPISENVAKMLRYFRRRGKSRYVWIDALCLDQNNHAEKSQQINRMDSIYRLAGKVKIWLGEAEPVADISGSFGLFSGLYHLGTEDTSEDFHHALIRSTKIPPQSLTLFFSRPWFSRRWVLQEAVLCPFTSVQCGIFSVPWIHLRDSVRIIESLCVNHNGKSNFSNSQIVLNSFIAELRVTSASREVMRVLCRLQNSKEQLLTLLWDFDTSRCTDPGDKLRALYGLGDIPPLVLDKINADSSFHWSALFEGFAKYLIENEQSWQLISHLFAFGSLRLNDSSWSSFTPDWSRKRLDGFLSRKSAELSAFVSRVKTRLSFCQPVWQGGNQRLEKGADWEDSWKPFLSVISHDYGYSETIRSRAANLMKAVFEAELVVKPMEQRSLFDFWHHSHRSLNRPDYAAFGEWLSTSHGRQLEGQTSWIKQCVKVLPSLFEHHTFFARNVDGWDRSDTASPTFGFGPLDLDPSDVILNFNAHGWTHKGMILFCVLRPDRKGNNIVSRLGNVTSYQLVGPCFMFDDAAEFLSDLHVQTFVLS